jgi:hypothetical protein
MLPAPFAIAKLKAAIAFSVRVAGKYGGRNVKVDAEGKDMEGGNESEVNDEFDDCEVEFDNVGMGEPIHSLHDGDACGLSSSEAHREEPAEGCGDDDRSLPHKDIDLPSLYSFPPSAERALFPCLEKGSRQYSAKINTSSSSSCTKFVRVCMGILTEDRFRPRIALV